MTKCGFCNECKKPMTIMWPICGIAMNIKNQPLLWDPICGYYNECKKTSRYYGILYVGIAMDVKNQRLLWDLTCEYCNVYIKPMAIKGPICGYCIHENGLMEFIIENDVGIICLKCVYCFKSL
jgi:hypothetical protein